MTTGAHRPTIAEIFADGRAIDEAVQRAADHALEVHEREGADLVVFHDNRVVWVTAKRARELAARDRARR